MGLSIEEIARKLTLAGLEVDEILYGRFAMLKTPHLACIQPEARI